MAPRISVLLPTHNRCDVIGRAIESALAQTLADFELLVVGDGCTDATGEVVQRYDDRRIVWLDWPKAPAFGYANRNRALRQARGTQIAYLAHDDLWLPDHLERLAACLDEERADWGYSRPLDVSTDGHIRPQVFNLNDPLTRRLWRERHIGYLSISNVMHTRACLSRYGFWNEQLTSGADWELWMRILAGGDWHQFAYDPVPTSLHFVASWRRNDESWPQRCFRRARAWEGSIPSDLLVEVPEGVTPQDAVWRACCEGSDPWVRRLRRAVDVDLDRRSRLLFPLSSTFEVAAAVRRRFLPRVPPWPVYQASLTRVDSQS